MVEDESSRTNSDMLRLGWMIDLVGCSCNLPTSYLPRVRVRVATVSRLVHLRLLGTLGIGGVGVCGVRRIDPVMSRVRSHAVLRLQYHIRI